MHQCKCESGKRFSLCCKPFLSGDKRARTVSQLMRSRYCAFALGMHGDYLYRTWHPTNRGSLTALDLNEKSVSWNGLRIVSSNQTGNGGTVEFVAHFEDDNSQPGTHHEISRFIRDAGQWQYLDGKIIST